MTRLILACLALIFATAAHAEISGVYNGIETADGMRLEFSPGGETIEGVFTDLDGQARPFKADNLENGAETVIERQGQSVYLLFKEEPLGLLMIAIPMTEAEELVTNRTQAYVFIKAGVAPPPTPERYVPPPAGPGGTVAPQAFVESYPFWPSVNVGYGYEMLRGRNRTLIRLHPLVQADILWKMCRAQSSPAGLAEALRGQGVTCQDVLSHYGRMMGGGGAVDVYNRYQRDLEAERQALIEAFRCSVDYRRNDPECKASARALAQRTISLDTVASALRRY